MKGPYLENHEMKQLDDLLQHAASDTISCWIATRLNCASASLACEGNISLTLLRTLDDKLLERVRGGVVIKTVKQIKEFEIPNGLTCGDCVHFSRCEWLIQATTGRTECDWLPIRFKLKGDKNDDAPKQ